MLRAAERARTAGRMELRRLYAATERRIWGMSSIATAIVAINQAVKDHELSQERADDLRVRVVREGMRPPPWTWRARWRRIRGRLRAGLRAPRVRRRVVVCALLLTFAIWEFWPHIRIGSGAVDWHAGDEVITQIDLPSPDGLLAAGIPARVYQLGQPDDRLFALSYELNGTTHTMCLPGSVLSRPGAPRKD